MLMVVACEAVLAFPLPIGEAAVCFGDGALS